MFHLSPGMSSSEKSPLTCPRNNHRNLILPVVRGTAGETSAARPRSALRRSTARAVRLRASSRRARPQNLQVIRVIYGHDCCFTVGPRGDVETHTRPGESFPCRRFVYLVCKAVYILYCRAFSYLRAAATSTSSVFSLLDTFGFLICCSLYYVNSM